MATGCAADHGGLADWFRLGGQAGLGWQAALAKFTGFNGLFGDVCGKGIDFSRLLQNCPKNK